MAQNFQPLASSRKNSLSLWKLSFLLVTLTLPAVFYLVTRHLPFIVVFLSVLTSISVYITWLRNKK